MNIINGWYTSQEFASISELELGETITCSQLACSCARVSSFELKMVQVTTAISRSCASTRLTRSALAREQGLSAARALAHGLVAVR
jgi:hypothetical protein